MKKIILALIVLSFSPQVLAESVNLAAIAKIESNNNPNAKGDWYKGKPRALGLYQLHSEPIIDYNLAHGTNYSHKDALDPLISRKIAVWTLENDIPRRLRQKHLKTSLNSRLQAWNRGVTRMVKKPKVPRKTRRYLRRYSEYVK